MSFDLIIIGAGMAGLPCAIRSADKKKKVLLVNKNKEIGGKLPRSTGQIAAAGTNIQKRKKIQDSPDLHLRESWKICNSTADLKLLRLAIDNAADTVNWLEKIGVKFPEDHPVITYQHDIYSTRRYQWPIGYGKEILECMSTLINKHIISNNITLLNETILIDFIKDNNNEINGVTLLNNQNKKINYYSNNIVLTAGGYTNNEKLFNKFSPKVTLYTPKFSGSRGLVHELAQSYNIKIDGGHLYKGMIGGVLKKNDDKNSVSIALNTIPQDRQPWEIWVNCEGKRFMREDHPSADYRRHKVNKQPKQKFYIIFDEGVFINAPPISMTSDGGLQSHIKQELVFKKYQSIEELANGINVKFDNLFKTLKKYNTSVANKEDLFGREHLPREIEGPTYYSIESVAFALPSPAGIAINEKFRVLNNDNIPIKNLYAAGEIIGNTRIMGEHYIAGMGVGPTLTFGKLLGEILQ